MAKFKNSMHFFLTQEDKVTISWYKEGGSLPEGRINSNSDGILIITDVKTQDQGVYICKATSSYFVVTDKAILEIGIIDSGRD